MQFINLKTQQSQIKDTLNQRISQVLSHGKYIMGPEVYELEEKLAAFVGAKHCIAVGNGTDALLIAMMALDIRPGDEVITPAFNYIACMEMIALLGAKPVLVDIDPETYNIDPKHLSEVISSKTKLITAVSLYGQCYDFDEVNAIAKRYGVPVIEDAAQSLGATYHGRMSCSQSDIATTSFFPSKPLGCYGDGGACFTNSDELAEKVRQIRVHGQSRRYVHSRLGVNSRLDTLQAAILLAKLEKFDEEINLRQTVAQNYNKLLKDVVKLPSIKLSNRSVYAQYTVEVDDRKQVRDFLHEEGIPTAVHYPIPVYKQEAFSNLFEPSVVMPNSVEVADHVLSLPMHPYLSFDEQVKVSASLKKAVVLSQVA